jgi:small-conductance mechanosensitive channel
MFGAHYVCNLGPLKIYTAIHTKKKYLPLPYLYFVLFYFFFFAVCFHSSEEINYIFSSENHNWMLLLVSYSLFVTLSLFKEYFILFNSILLTNSSKTMTQSLISSECAVHLYSRVSNIIS